MGSGAVAPEFSKQEGLGDGIVSEFDGEGVHVFLRVSGTVGPSAFLVFGELAVSDEEDGVGLAENEEGKFVVGDAVHVVFSQA